VCVNKMDLVEYDQEVFDKIEREYRVFLKKVDINPRYFVPVSAMQGANLATRGDTMPWYNGITLLAGLDSFEKEESLVDKPFRMHLQDVYKFTAEGDDRRICAGRIESGRLNVGDEVIFLPSQKKSKVASIESFNEELGETIEATRSSGFTLSGQIFVTRGELVCKTDEDLSKISSKLRVNLFWMGHKPMVYGKPYFLKIGTDKVQVSLAKINLLIDFSSDYMYPSRLNVSNPPSSSLSCSRPDRSAILENFPLFSSSIISATFFDSDSTGEVHGQHPRER